MTALEEIISKIAGGAIPQSKGKEQVKALIMEVYKQGVRNGWNKSGEGYNAEYSHPNSGNTEDEVVNDCIEQFNINDL